MVINREKIKSIIEVLTKNGDSTLTKEFRTIVSMARSRQQARYGIEDQSLPIFLHLIPFAILVDMGISPPTSWKSEIKAFLGSIDFKNSGKKRVWFSDEQIQKMLNDLLTLQVKKQIINKLESFKQKPYHKILVSKVNDFFIRKQDLQSLGIVLKHIQDNEGIISLSLFIKGNKIF